MYTVSVGGSYTDQQLEGFMLVAVPLNAQDETTSMGTFQVTIFISHLKICKIRLVNNQLLNEQSKLLCLNVLVSL